MLAITILSFLVVHLAPGDPITLLAGGASDASDGSVTRLRQAYGLDQPLPVQYAVWLGHLLRGDLGQSLIYHRPVFSLIADALPNTMGLTLTASLLALAAGIPLGVAAARFRGGIVDQAVRVFSVAGHALPAFWFGLLIILVLAVDLRWLPTGGLETIGASPWDLSDRLRHLVGPAVTLSLAGIANYSRLMRTETIEVVGQDFVRTARGKGLGGARVLWIHGLRNALLPLVTALGGLLARILSGSVVVEQVFAWPGMGRLTFDAATAKDYPTIMGVVVVSSLLLVAGYLLRDLAYAAVDPRVSAA
jgi:peptide/nickel transport system permease protein